MFQHDAAARTEIIGHSGGYGGFEASLTRPSPSVLLP